ncbi:MAG: sugar phosphate isomerase/epimerase family protein [Opitutales bacterium]
MPRPVTLFTGQWADLPFDKMCETGAALGYDGLELACWGDHIDVFQAAESTDYCKQKRATLEKHGLQLHAISNHLGGQLVCDPNDDARSDIFAPPDTHGDPEKKRAWAVSAMKATAHAAKNLEVQVVNGFVGSSIWHMLYSFPPVSEEMIAAGFAYFAEMWNPIFDEFDQCGVRFGLEVHPTEIAFDIYTAQRALEAVNHRETFGFNFDPSHLHWQFVDPVEFINAFPDRIYHAHMKDAARNLDGKTGILGSHLDFGDYRRGWDFRSVGRGEVDFQRIIRALNRIGYTGPLSIEWEDSGMDRLHGGRESCEFVKRLDFAPSNVAFDAAFDDKNR